MSLTDDQIFQIKKLLGHRPITADIMDRAEAIAGGGRLDWRFYLDSEVKQTLGPEILADEALGRRIMQLLVDDQGNLDLIHVNLDRFPPGLPRLSGLRALRLNGNTLTELPDEIGELTRLRDLDLGSCALTRISPELGRLRELKRLSLSYNRDLAELPDVLDGLESLESFEASGCALTALPPSIGGLKRLKYLHLTGQKLAALPETIGGLESLVTLDLTSAKLKTLPPEIGQLRQLQHLDLSRNEVEALPPEIGRLESLRTLVAHNNRLKSLPETIGELTELESLDLHKNQLTQLPDAFAKLTKLRFLSLQGNKLTDLPPSMRRLESLEQLQLASNKIKGMPEVVFHLRLQDATGLPGPRARKLKDRLKLIRGCHQANLDVEAIKRVYDLYLGKDVDREVTFEALKVPQFGDEVLAEIFTWPESGLKDHPLRKGSVITFEGKSSMKKTEAKSKLEEIGLGYSPKIKKGVTHVVLGRSPKDVKGLAQGKHAFISEQELVSFLETFEERFLLEEEAAQEGAVGNVEELLRSEDDASVALGLEVLESGGVPDEVMTELFIIAKLSPKKKLKAKARRLIDLHGSQGVRAAVKDRRKLLSDAHKAEKLTEEALNAYGRSYPSLDWVRVAYELIRLRGRGFRFLYDRTKPGHPLRDRALRGLLKNGVIDFGGAFMGYTPHYRNAYAYYFPPAFPIEVVEWPGVVELRLQGCAFGQLPPEIGQMTGLRRLDLASNQLTDLPEALADLTGLEDLNLSDNQLKEVPEVLARLTSLQRLNIRNNRRGTEDVPLTAPPELREALPNCQILDG